MVPDSILFFRKTSPHDFATKGSLQSDAGREPCSNLDETLSGDRFVRTRLQALLLSVAFFALAQTDIASACACCTNPGQRYVENTKLDTYRRSVIDEVRFAKDAVLYTDERDLADIKGIANPSLQPYAFSVTQQKDRFVFSFRDGKKNEGTIALALSGAISVFEVDTRDEEHKDKGLGPLLYKEWRLTAPLVGTGSFKAGNGGYQRITLILQGRGRGCTDAAHFTHWTISVHGPLGNYLFYGELVKQ